MSKVFGAIILMIVILIVSFVIRQKPVSVSPESEAINIQKKIGSDGNDIDISANCPTEFLTSQTAGPYYKAGSPLRQSLIEVGAVGEKIIITGLVFDRNCNPITNAWLDFWQADGNGDYDNQGWQLRGNQYTDSNGRYTLETVMPAQYSGRPPHIHLKLQAKESSPVLISQLYFPGQSENETDAIFNSSLIVMMSDDGQTANYNFKIDTE